MTSDFSRYFNQSADERVKARQASARAGSAREARIERAAALTAPHFEDFAANALPILRKEGVWCSSSWALPDGDVTFTLDRLGSGVFRKRWKVSRAGYSFMALTTRGSLMATSWGGDAPSGEYALLARMAIGGKETLEALRSEQNSDTPFVPRLFYRTDRDELSIVSGRGYPLEAEPFIEYGARAIESLVSAWRKRST